MTEVTEPPPIPPRPRRRRAETIALGVAVLAAGALAALLLLPDGWGDRDAAAVADGVVEALADGDQEEYRDLLCEIDEGEDELPSPVVEDDSITATVVGLRHYPGEGTPDGQQEHYRATLAVGATDVVLLINEEEEDEGSWCLVHAFPCVEPSVDAYDPVTSAFCGGRPTRIETR